jgi:predicted DNA-binding transcriptional regulator AlpA
MMENQENMSFRTYYNELKTQHVELRDKICEVLGISTKTFYNKLNDDSFDYPQKLVISQMTGFEIDKLFPPTEIDQAV